MSMGDKAGLIFIKRALPVMQEKDIYGILGILESKEQENIHGKYNQEIKVMCNKELDKRMLKHG